MNSYQEIINEIKNSQKEIFKVNFTDNKEIVLKVCDSSDETISLLTKWRTEYGEWFDTKFLPTPEKTRKWIEEKILQEKQRILFLIFYDNQKIGHLGLDLFRPEDNSIFICDVMRGERGFAPGLMVVVFKQFIKWLQNELKISIIRLRVFHDDEKAISLYKKCGLKKSQSIPMKKEITEEGWKWIEQENDNKVAERFFQVMEIKK